MQNFNFHQHTYRCGHAAFNFSDEDYVVESISQGLKTICFTDHAPNRIDKRKRMRMSYDEKDDYLASIEKLKDKYRDMIDIYTGYEVEYTKDNEEELKKFKKESEILILGQHFIICNGEVKVANYEKYTDEDMDNYAQTIEEALSLGIIDILAHPDFVMLAREDFKSKDEEIANRILQAAEKYNVPVEINLNKIFAKTYFDYKNRKLKDYKNPEEYLENLQKIKYPCKKFWDIATNYDIKVLYGLDTHFKGQISLFSELVYLANKVIGEDTIKKLNFCNLEDIIKTKNKVR